jgi:hypothetical protein
MEFDGKVAIVTGATSGIGMATARKFVGFGACAERYPRKCRESRSRTDKSAPEFGLDRRRVCRLRGTKQNNASTRPYRLSRRNCGFDLDGLKPAPGNSVSDVSVP